MIRSKIEAEVKRLAVDEDFDSSKTNFEIKGGVHLSWDDEDIQIIAECHINGEKADNPYFDLVKASQEYVCQEISMPLIQDYIF